eukprot:scaffold202138_cov39-Prasinocladus_malaysianus.AAC.2
MHAENKSYIWSSGMEAGPGSGIELALSTLRRSWRASRRVRLEALTTWVQAKNSFPPTTKQMLPIMSWLKSSRSRRCRLLPGLPSPLSRVYQLIALLRWIEQWMS